MGDTAVQDMDPVHAAAHRLGAVGELGQHAAADIALLDELLRVSYADPGNEGIGIIDIPVKAGDVCQIDQLVGAHGHGNGCCRFVCIDVVGIVEFIHADGGNDGQVIVGQGIKDDLGIHLCDFSHEADILAAGEFLLYL